MTQPRAYQARFKHLELIAIHDTTVLLVLVLHDGTIRQQTFALESARSQDELSRGASRINERCLDAAVAKIEELFQQDRALSAPMFDELEQQVLELVVKAMRQLEEQVNSQIHSDGLIEMLNQPEFAQVERVRQVLALLQGGKGLGPLIPRVLASNGVQVVIGGEHSRDEMREYSIRRDERMKLLALAPWQIDHPRHTPAAWLAWGERHSRQNRWTGDSAASECGYRYLSGLDQADLRRDCW